MKLTAEELNKIKTIVNGHGYNRFRDDMVFTVKALLDHITELERERDEAAAGAYEAAIHAVSLLVESLRNPNKSEGI